jgi:hypothetical protein
LTEAVGLGTLLAGYQQAYNRWMAGPRIDTDPDQAFFGIFEALNWAVVVDNRLKETLLGWPGGYDGRDYLIGFRYGGTRSTTTGLRRSGSIGVAPCCPRRFPPAV